MAQAIAAELGLSPGQRRAVQVAAALHHVGKILVAGEILNESDRLTLLKP